MPILSFILQLTPFAFLLLVRVASRHKNYQQTLFVCISRVFVIIIE
jgi:hypothetical protein